MWSAIDLPLAWRLAWQGGDILIQLVVLCACLACALLCKALWKRLPQRTYTELRWQVVAESVSRTVYSVSAVVLLGLSQLVLHHYAISVALLHQFAIPLMSALAIIRLSVYLLRYIFGTSTWLLASGRWIARTVWCVVALQVFDILSEILSLLDSVRLPLGKHTLTLLELGSGITVIICTLLGTLWLSSWLEKRLMLAVQLDANYRVVFAKLSRVILFFIGIMLALPLVGVDLTLFSVFGGALGVGLGFGLQKIASNYVSGFIILLDKSIRPGDSVIIDNRQGQITQFTGRYVVVRALNGTEAIIPNETLITSTVVNLSYSDPKVRINLSVQVAYGTDMELAMALVLAAGKQPKRVLTDPLPVVIIKNLLDNGIELELIAWIADPEIGEGVLRSQIFLQILQSFKEAGIIIPCPQRDIYVHRVKN